MNEAALLVAGLYAHDGLLTHASTTFSGYELFNQLTDPGCKIMWECMRNTYKTTGRKPTIYMLGHQSDAALRNVDDLVRPKAYAQCAEVLELLGYKEPPAAREHTLVLLQEAARVAALDKLLTSATAVGTDTPNLIEFVDDVSTMLNAVAPKQGVRKRPLAKDQRQKLLRSVQRRAWGVPYWDASGLSWNAKELHGLLGPSGGGKTVNMTNIATALIKQGYNVMVALYEQALEEDVEQRIISNVCTVPMTALRGKEEHEIDPKYQARINAACAEYEDKLVVFDMIGENAGTGGVQELRSMTDEEFQETGFVPDMIITDWLGAMVSRYGALGATDAAYRRCCEKFMFDIVEWKEDKGHAHLVLHQTNTTAQEKSPAFEPNKNMAHEFKSFGNFTDTCSVLGKMDNELKVCHFIPDKSRRSLARSRLIQLEGEWMRFKDVTGEFEIFNNTFISTFDADARREEVAERRQNEEGAW